jgi:hypothetical protein
MYLNIKPKFAPILKMWRWGEKRALDLTAKGTQGCQRVRSSAIPSTTRVSRARQHTCKSFYILWRYQCLIETTSVVYIVLREIKCYMCIYDHALRNRWRRLRISHFLHSLQAIPKRYKLPKVSRVRFVDTTSLVDFLASGEVLYVYIWSCIT